MTTAQLSRPLALICLTVSLSSRPADAGETIVDCEFATALDLEGWTIAKSLNAAIVSAQGRDGALSLDGTLGPKDSSYFMCSEYFALQPRQHYRLHARLKVVRYDAPGYQRPSWGTCAGDIVPPMLVSVALCDASRKQLVPPARSYNMDELGTWQDLRIDFLTTTDMRAGRLRLNKQMAPSVSMEMLIDHLKVEHVKPVPRPTFVSETPEQLTRDGVAHRTVPLRVLGWPEGVTRPWPVSSGIPLPAGELVDPSHVRLTDDGGRSVPFQTEAVSRWQDGSVRWLLVDAQVDAPKTLSLHYGREVNTPPRTALRIEDTPERVRIDTGALELSIKRQGFDLLERVVRDGRELLRPGEDRFTLVTADGVVHRASRDLESRVSVLRRGPLHVALEARGWLVPDQGKRRFAYEARLDAYAGMDLLGLGVTFINKSDADREPIQSVSINLPLAQQPKQWNLCGTTGQGPGWLLQGQDDHFTTRAGTGGTRSAGWAVAGPCGVAVRHWWQNHAKGFEVGPEGLRIELWPRRHAEPYACPQGTAKTHEMVLRFAPKVDDAAELSALVHAMPQLAASPEWNCGTKVCGDMITTQESAWPWFDEKYARAINGYENVREKHKFYGVRDFGDWARAPDPVLRPKEKGLYFDNNSRGMDISLYQQYLRTGNIRYLRVARQITLHQMDIDTIHHHPTRPDLIGATHSQCVNNWHVTNPPNPVYSYYGGELLLSALTGDPRAYRTAKGTADWHVTQAGVGSFAYSPGYGYDRACGWSLAGYMDMYEASWERKYLEAAERIVACVFVRATREHGGAPVPVGNHMSRYGGCSWMAGCLCYGLVRYHTRTGDPRAASALTTIADWLVDVMWRPEIGGFRSKQSERVFKVGTKNTRCVIGLPYAYRLNPRLKYLEVFQECLPTLREQLGPQCARGQVQKAFSWCTRFAPMFWYHFSQTGFPVAIAGPDRLIPADLKLRVDGSGSRAFAGKRIVKYEWDFGDGAAAQGVRAEHTYATPGSYKVTLHVTAANGKTDDDSFFAQETPTDEHVSNPSFEADHDNDGVPDGWSIRCIGKPRTVWDREVARSGQRSMRMECDDVGVETHIFQLNRPVLPGRKYVFSCWIKTADAVIQKRHNKTGPYAIVYPRPQEIYRCAAVAARAGTTDWKRYEARFKTQPTDRTIDIYCKYRHMSGRVWFDDVSLRLAE